MFAVIPFKLSHGQGERERKLSNNTLELIDFNMCLFLFGFLVLIWGWVYSGNTFTLFHFACGCSVNWSKKHGDFCTTLQSPLPSFFFCSKTNKSDWCCIASFTEWYCAVANFVWSCDFLMIISWLNFDQSGFLLIVFYSYSFSHFEHNAIWPVAYLLFNWISLKRLIRELFLCEIFTFLKSKH